DADHRPVTHATIDLRHALAGMLPTDVGKTEETIRIAAQCLENLIVLLPEPLRRGVGRPGHSHVKANALDPHAVGVHEQVPDALLRSPARNTRHVEMKVPDDIRHDDDALPKAEGPNPLKIGIRCSGHDKPPEYPSTRDDLFDTPQSAVG